VNNHKLIKSLFGVTTLLIALGYLLSIWYADPILAEMQFKRVGSKTIFFATLLSVVAGIFNAILWFKINHHIVNTINFSTSYWAWSVGRIYRYIPGKVAGYYIRNKLQKSPIKLGVAASINELLLTLLPIIFIVIIYLVTSKTIMWLVPLLLLLLFSLYFIKPILMAFPKVNTALSSHGLLFFSPREATDKLWFILPAMSLQGISFYLIINAGLSEYSISLYQAVLALYISGIIGQLALVSPGGLGVREAAIVILLTSFGLSPDLAISAALISRVTLILSELCNVALAYILKQGQKT